MITLTKKQIREIADILDSGMKCLFHKITQEIEYIPDSRSHEYYDPDQWMDIIDKIDEHLNCKKIWNGLKNNWKLSIMDLS